MSSSISEAIAFYQKKLPEHVCLVAVSKTKPTSYIQEAYQAGQLDFGENKVQELVEKSPQLPGDIRWHMIGHLQRNKVKYIAPFVHLIHAVDSWRLLEEIQKQAHKNERVIKVLLQIHIAEEGSKFGLAFKQAEEIIFNSDLQNMRHVAICGLMGMATFTSDESKVNEEFERLNGYFEAFKKKELPENVNMQWLSMGMSGDYELALENGSNMVRIGSSIFGSR